MDPATGRVPVAESDRGPRHAPIAVPARLIEDAKRGSQDAFAGLYRAYAPAVQRYLDTVSPGLSAEVASATWESVARSLPRFNGDGDQFRRWIMTIARRRLVDEVRRSTRGSLTVASVPEEPHVDRHDREESIDWAVDALRQIPTRQADVVALRVIGGLAVGEVADLLGISNENVRVLSHRGLSALKLLLETGKSIGEAGPGELRSVV